VTPRGLFALNASQCDRAALRFSGTVTIPRTLWRLFAMNYALLIGHLLFDVRIAHRRIRRCFSYPEASPHPASVADIAINGDGCR
jgi:hypothetical protein